MRAGTGNTGRVRVTGVDGCRDGWAAVELDVDGAGGPVGTVAVRVAGSLTELLAGTAAGQVVGIDMPLGLLARGWRTADGEARRRLGPRRSSIFGIPPAAVWQQPDYQTALAECRRLTGQGFSIQAWGLRPKLLEAGQYRGPARSGCTRCTPSCRSPAWPGRRCRARAPAGRASPAAIAAGRGRAGCAGRPRPGAGPPPMCWTRPPWPGPRAGSRPGRLVCCPIRRRPA